MSLLVQVIIENIVHISLYLNIHMITRSLFGNKLIFYLLDNTCLVWGKTCSGTGNCWLYNGEALRYLLNFTAASEYLTKRLHSKKTVLVVHNSFYYFRFRNNRYAIRCGRLVFCQRCEDFWRGDRTGGYSRGTWWDPLKNNWRLSSITLSAYALRAWKKTWIKDLQEGTNDEASENRQIKTLQVP